MQMRWNVCQRRIRSGRATEGPKTDLTCANTQANGKQ